MQKKFQARQGDIFFEAVSGPPKNCKPYKSAILAYGEVTGHSHQIMSPPISEMESYIDEDGDIFVLSKTEPISVGHDEHTQIIAPVNTWICVSRQREYDPVLEKNRVVAD